MGKIVVSNADGYKVPHDDFVSLYQKGILTFAINTTLATNLISSKYPNLKPQGTSSAAFTLWSWVAVGVFGVSIYFSFMQNWWWFIVGFIAMRLIWKANKKGNAENYLDAALNDPSFYNNIQSINGWLYQIEEENLNAFEKYKF